MKESTAVEGRLKRRVERELGGMCWKLVPVVAGIPDRLVILPGGRFYPVETKQPKGEVRPSQSVMAARLARIGVEVTFLWSPEAVDEWVEARRAEAP